MFYITVSWWWSGRIPMVSQRHFWSCPLFALTEQIIDSLKHNLFVLSKILLWSFMGICLLLRVLPFCVEQDFLLNLLDGRIDCKNIWLCHVLSFSVEQDFQSNSLYGHITCNDIWLPHVTLLCWALPVSNVNWWLHWLHGYFIHSFLYYFLVLSKIPLWSCLMITLPAWVFDSAFMYSPVMLSKTSSWICLTVALFVRVFDSVKYYHFMLSKTSN